MDQKIRVGILFGGRSAEHEVSLQSAKNIIEAIDRQKFDVTLIGIDKAGRWMLQDETDYLLNADNPKTIVLQPSKRELGLAPGGAAGPKLIDIANPNAILPVDVIFPVLHGPFGEDGTVQGLLKLAGIPFVGASVLGSSVGMDKDVMKRLLRDAGILIADFVVLHKGKAASLDFEQIRKRLRLPFFIKPANLGSSVGIHKVHSESEFYSAIEDAFLFDQKIIIEENIEGREIECSVLGNEQPIASLAGEIIPKHEFYSYDAKYIDDVGALLNIPAELPEDKMIEVQSLAVKTYEVLCCEGMARVDFFLKENGELLVNEINTIPGFTKISMYPKLWEVSGLPYSNLLERLIELALDRHAQEQRLKTNQLR
ncbi:MAG: D-alanine--D-alanine ligase [Deferribacteres bacterium]|nr:D-alanine--D-alanine ligase [candidate division KSB1 bacterium]MCB9512553.1 D-alanine--D-alanine ligase [Deferribacteres bacterium]